MEDLIYMTISSNGYIKLLVVNILNKLIQHYFRLMEFIREQYTFKL